MQKILFGLIFVVFALPFFTASSFAQIPTPTSTADPCANPDSTTTDNEGAEISTKPSIECIDEAVTRQVEVTFHNLEPDGTEYVICTGSGDCLKEEGFILAWTGPGKENFIGAGAKKFKANDNGNLTLKFCGDGSSKAKECENVGTSYFHGGNIYFLSVGIISDQAYYKPISRGGFYVARSYPKITVDPSSNITLNSQIKVTVTRGDPPLGGGKERNNFQLSFGGGVDSIHEEKCFNNLSTQGGSYTYTSPKLRTGTYIIKINDQNSERNVSVGTPLGSLSDRGDGCQGGFTYYHIKCTVTNVTDEKKGTCSKPEEGRDPKGQEYRAFLKDLAQMARGGASINFPCRDGKINSGTNPNDCPYVETAIGRISPTPQGFIKDIFRIVLFFATFGGIIIIIYSGYMLMISRGDKEKIAGARETITSAIVGLLFIVLSIVILDLIGVQILRIPGFGP